MTTALNTRAYGRAAWCAVASTVIGMTWLPLRARAEPARPRIEATSPELQFRLPIEIVQGAIKESASPAWVANVQVLPGLAYGGLELNALLAGGYTNPHWDAQLGLRASYPVINLFAGIVQFRLAGEGGYLLVEGDPRLGFGLIADLSALARIGLWGGHDFDRHAYYWQVTVGVDLLSWHDPAGAVVRAGPMPEHP